MVEEVLDHTTTHGVAIEDDIGGRVGQGVAHTCLHILPLGDAQMVDMIRTRRRPEVVSIFHVEHWQAQSRQQRHRSEWFVQS